MSESNSYILEYEYCTRYCAENGTGKFPRDVLLSGIPLIVLVMAVYLSRKEKKKSESINLDAIKQDLIENHVREQGDGTVEIVGYNTGRGERFSGLYMQSAFIYCHGMEGASDSTRELFLLVMIIYPFLGCHSVYDKWELEGEWKDYIDSKAVDWRCLKEDAVKDGSVKQVKPSIEELPEIEQELRTTVDRFYETYIRKKDMYCPRAGWKDMVITGYNSIF